MLILFYNRRQAPTISQRNTTTDSELVEHWVIHIPTCQEGIMVSSASEKENEVTDLWVDNGAYCFSHTEHRIVCSQRGWLTDIIIGAAQMLVLQFYLSISEMQTPLLPSKGNWISGPFWRVCSDCACQEQPLVCGIHRGVCERSDPCVYTTVPGGPHFQN